MSANYLLGVDLGGTKIEAALLDAKTLNVLVRERVATEGHLGYDHILNNISVLANAVCDKYNFTPGHIGIATPGTLDPMTQTMKNCNTTALNGRHMKADLEKFWATKYDWPTMPIVLPLRKPKWALIKKRCLRQRWFLVLSWVRSWRRPGSQRQGHRWQAWHRG